MRPHRSYLTPIRKLLQAETVPAPAHITGAGLTVNLPRMVPRALAAQVELGSGEPPPIFRHLQPLSGTDLAGRLRTFNMGIGMVAVIPPELLKKARAVLSRMGESSVVMGKDVCIATPRVIHC